MKKPFKPLLILYMGLPRAGKSTFRDRRMSSYTRTPVVCPDEIRKALGCFPYCGKREKEVWHIARIMTETLFSTGSPVVILDATNVTRKRRGEWVSDQWDRAVLWIDTDKEVCKERATANGQLDLLPVIDRMAAELQPPDKDIEGLVWIERFYGGGK